MSDNEFETEWGVSSKWGTHPVNDRAGAEKIASNMNEAGHEVRIVWRSISPWFEEGTDKKVEASA